MTTEPTHIGPSPYHPGDTEHRGSREDCPGCDHDDTHRRGGRPRTPDGQLTPTELRAVAELARGGTYKEIAKRCGTSVEVIKGGVQRAHRRLGTHTHGHLVARAIGLRLIPAGIALTAEDREATP